MKAALPAAGVAKLRDVTKNTFGQFIDEDNRLGRQQTRLSNLIFFISYKSKLFCQHSWAQLQFGDVKLSVSQLLIFWWLIWRVSSPLESWGGCDDWEFTFEPEIRKPPTGLSRSTSDLVETETESDLRYEESLGSVADLSYQSSFSSVSLAPSSPSSQSVRKQPALLRLSPSQDLVFSPNSYGDLTARIQMWNVSPGPVAFKMKTTTPERFKVRPSNGCLSPGQSSMMDITVTKSHMSQSANLGRLSGWSESVIPLTSHLSAGQVSHLRHLCVRRGLGSTSYQRSAQVFQARRSVQVQVSSVLRQGD